MNEKTKNILNIDTIAEDLISKRNEDWDVETHITWQKFIEIAKSYGFKCGFCQKFTVTGWLNKKGIEEEEIIFFHEEKGLILYAESLGGKSVNSAKVYGEVKINEKLEENQYYALYGCSAYGRNRNGTMSIEVDVRQGFLSHLEAISKAFKFSTKWTKVPFLWFLNYMENEKDDFNYKKITEQKIKACTPEVRKIIFG